MSGLTQFLVDYMNVIVGFFADILGIFDGFFSGFSAIGTVIAGFSQFVVIAFQLVPVEIMAASITLIAGTFLYNLFRSNWGA